MTPGSSTTGGVSLGGQSGSGLTVEDAEVMSSQSFLLSGVSPVISTFAQAVGGTGNWRAPILGVAVGYQVIRDWNVVQGEFFDETDVRTMRREVVLGNTVAENLFPNGDAVGQQLRLRDVPLTIVGVLEAKGQTAEGSDQDDVILVPYTTVQNRPAGRQFVS